MPEDPVPGGARPGTDGASGSPPEEVIPRRTPFAQRSALIVVGEGTTITDLEIPLARESHRP